MKKKVTEKTDGDIIDIGMGLKDYNLSTFALMKKTGTLYRLHGSFDKVIRTFDNDPGRGKTMTEIYKASNLSGPTLYKTVPKLVSLKILKNKVINGKKVYLINSEEFSFYKHAVIFLNTLWRL